MSKNNTKKKNIAIIAPLTSYSGYGLYGRAISLMIQDIYQDSDLVLLFIFNSVLVNIQELIFNLKQSKYKDLIISPLNLLKLNVYDVMITVSDPHGLNNMGLYNIGITALALVDKVHPSIIKSCNLMDLVWVMSQFNINSLLYSKFTLNDGKKLLFLRPVKLLPHPFMCLDFKPNKKGQVTLFIDNIPQKNLFVSVGLWITGSVGNDRKDIGMLCTTFLKKYANSKLHGLLLKVDHGRSSVISLYFLRLRINLIYKVLNIQCTHENVYFISGNIKLLLMLLMYNHEKVKAYVSFSHGESWGIPIMLFSGITGKPLLIPYHSGFMDYIQPLYCLILLHKVTLVPLLLFNTFYINFLIPLSRWNTVDYQYAAYKFTELILNLNTKKHDRYKQQQKYIRLNFSYLKVKNILKSYMLSIILTKEKE